MKFLLQILSWALAALPLGVALGIGRGLGWLLGSALRLRRRTALSALRASFPEKDQHELVRIVNGMYRHLGMTLVDVARLSVKGLADLEDRIHIRGQDHVDAMAASTDGALLLIGHIGNWEAGGWICRMMPNRFSVVVKPMHNASLQAYIGGMREKVGMRPLPFRGSYRECLKALKANEVLSIVLDQNTKRSHGVFVDFFGRTACATPGLAILSAQSGASVFPLYCIRRDDYAYELHLLEPIPAPANRRGDTLQAATQHYTRVLEQIIREYPEQWMWIHKRWRTQPKPPEAE